MGGGKLDREGGLKTSLPEKGASYIRELGGSLFEGTLNVPINYKLTHVPQAYPRHLTEVLLCTEGDSTQTAQSGI